jgi:hypothetical protein
MERNRSRIGLVAHPQQDSIQMQACSIPSRHNSKGSQVLEVHGVLLGLNLTLTHLCHNLHNRTVGFSSSPHNNLHSNSLLALSLANKAHSPLQHLNNHFLQAHLNNPNHRMANHHKDLEQLRPALHLVLLLEHSAASKLSTHNRVRDHLSSKPHNNPLSLPPLLNQTFLQRYLLSTLALSLAALHQRWRPVQQGSAHL